MANKASKNKLGHVSRTTREDGTLIPTNLIMGDDGKEYNLILEDYMIIEDLKAIILNIGVNSVASDDTHMYIGGIYDSKFFKYSRPNFSLVGTSSIAAGIRALVIDVDHVYVGDVNGYIRKYNKSNLGLVATSPKHDALVSCLAMAGEFIYAGGGPMGTIKKYSKSNLDLVATGSNEGGEVQQIEVDSEFIYTCGHSRKITKYNISNLVYVANFANTEYINCLALYGEYVYASSGGNNTIIRKHNKSNLGLTGSTYSSGVMVAHIKVQGDYVYVKESTLKIVILKTSDLLVVQVGPNIVLNSVPTFEVLGESIHFFGTTGIETHRRTKKLKEFRRVI